MKKFLIMICMLMMACPAFADMSIYPDVKTNFEYYPILVELQKKGIMIGCTDGLFRPYQPAKRSEYSRVIVKALKLDGKMVMSGVEFYDLTPENPDYDNMQIALYYDFVKADFIAKKIYPNGSIIRKYAIFPVGDYLTDKTVTVEQAKNILGKYKDRGTLRDEDLVEFAKADTLGILPVTGKEVKIDATKPITRLDLAVMAYNIVNQDYKAQSKKIEQVGAKKKAFGHRVKTSYVEGNVGTIPMGSELPVQMTRVADSQKSQLNETYEARIGWNLVTKERYLLVKEGSTVELKVADVNKRKFLRKNGKLRIEATTITTPYQKKVAFPAELVVNDKIGLGNKIFKFKRIKTTKKEESYLKMTDDVKVDLTTGKFVAKPEKL